MRMTQTYIVGDEARLVLLQSTNDALECRSDIREIGNTTTDNENLALSVRCSTGHEVNDRLRVLVCLALGGRAGVLAVVREFMRESMCGNGIRVDDRSTTTFQQRQS